MSRQYAKAEELNGEVFRKKAAGETNREKAESYGLQTIVSFYTFSICETYLPNPEYTQFYNFKRIELETASRQPNQEQGRRILRYSATRLSTHCTALCLI